MARILAESGLEAIEAPDGREAWRLLQKHDRSLRLVISDVVMPHITGTELVDTDSAVLAGLPVLLMSAYSTAELQIRGLGIPTCGIITKPFDAEHLMAEVEKAMRLRTSRERRREARPS